MNISKFVYGQPRPFWLSPEIIPYTCSSNYGNPSGHSFVASGFALMIWLDFAPPTVSAKIVIFVAVVVFSCMTGYSRMILGQHSLDQVFYGLALGVWAALTMHYCVRDRLFDHLKRNHYNYADLVLNNTVVLLILLIS
jgi:membrane-associated phospholipid phosphatase